jgi:hypothetical protein
MYATLHLSVLSNVNTLIQGLKVTPQMGGAVMFRTGVLDGVEAGDLGSPDYRLWHAGCHVKQGTSAHNSGGVIKLTMQKFTERALPR